ncbi:unnamed protein product [Larinioides sclopetarius]|uniref:Uncharacterized protein n=1 Tax=Larinioides sclopetarius TaxID=280406 RepID=A0AAV1ZIC4_9ARAC
MELQLLRKKNTNLFPTNSAMKPTTTKAPPPSERKRATERKSKEPTDTRMTKVSNES